MFDQTKAVYTALTNAVVEAAQTIEDSVGLVHNEINNLQEEQMLRLDEIKSKRIKPKSSSKSIKS